MKHCIPTALVCALALVAGQALAQTSNRVQVQPRAQPAPPAPTTAIASRPLPGAPSASGLPSPFPPAAPSIAVPGTSATGTFAPQDVTAVPPSSIGTGMEAQAADMQYTAPSTNVMGAGAYGTRGMSRPMAGPVSDVDIARSFMMADGNRDGELSRAEATRLTILPLSFEEMDANHDDRLTRSEYEEAVR